MADVGARGSYYRARIAEHVSTTWKMSEPPTIRTSKMFKKTDPDSRAGEARTKNRTSSPTSVIRNQDPTPIGPSIHISGHIRANEDLVVYGHIEGTINLGEGLLMVTREGRVDADVKARVINVEGRAEGDLQATDQIIVRRTGRVRGSITAPRIALDFGCTVSGSIDTGAAEESAPATRDDKIADFKSAISSAGDRSAGPAMGKSSPR